MGDHSSSLHGARHFGALRKLGFDFLFLILADFCRLRKQFNQCGALQKGGGGVDWDNICLPKGVEVLEWGLGYLAADDEANMLLVEESRPRTLFWFSV